MNRVARAYLVSVIALATAYVASQQWHSLITLDQSAWLAAIAFIILGVMAEVSVFWYNIGKGRAAVSIAFVPLLAGVILLPHPAHHYSLAARHPHESAPRGSTAGQLRRRRSRRGEGTRGE